MDAYEKQIMTLVKDKARAIRLSQKQVASHLGVSLPTVKRWWAGKGANLAVLGKLCGLLGVSLSQLFLELEGKTPAYTYTLPQEKTLVAHPKALALFDLLVSGETAVSIQKRYSLSERELSSMLLKLDKVGLLELHPSNKVKLVRRGEP